MTLAQLTYLCRPFIHFSYFNKFNFGQLVLTISTVQYSQLTVFTVYSLLLLFIPFCTLESQFSHTQSQHSLGVTSCNFLNQLSYPTASTYLLWYLQKYPQEHKQPSSGWESLKVCGAAIRVMKVGLNMAQFDTICSIWRNSRINTRRMSLAMTDASTQRVL